ncbi:MAG: trypsin-like peptidase domain-containing protein, partial [Bacteroidota bacterium]
MKFIAPFSCLLSLFLLMQSSTYAQTRQKASTVRIDCKDEYGMAVEEGAGLLVGEDESFYYGLTAFHVLEVGESHKIQLYQGVDEYEAEILQTVSALDIAFFKFPKEGKSLSGFYVGTWKDMKFGDEVRSVGHPAGEKWSINILNKLIAKEVDFDDRKFSISNQGIMGGCSGGPVFNQKGEWIGLITETGVVEAKGVKSEVLVKMLKSWGDLGNKIVSRNEAGTDSNERPQSPTSGREERPDQGEFTDMIRVLGGSFSMGSELGRPREEYPHKVELSTFMIGQHEVTNA